MDVLYPLFQQVIITTQTYTHYVPVCAQCRFIHVETNMYENTHSLSTHTHTNPLPLETDCRCQAHLGVPTGLLLGPVPFRRLLTRNSECFVFL